MAALHSGDVDAALARGDVHASGVTGTLLSEEDRLTAVSTGSELAARGELDWSELADHPVVANTVSGATSPDDRLPGNRPVRGAPRVALRLPWPTRRTGDPLLRRLSESAEPVDACRLAREVLREN
ncbi:LysR substrate-binding domain-containing protein [Amycolatopsis sp. NPDC052450]|uniref:LysR substrate-binding domain-containing protein n=1 Tax=Amycolatopsis sp. NPDC052450 TaxID=3363937 RepID=UPI0037CCAA88